MPFLVIKMGKGRLQQLELQDGDWNIGRGVDCDIVLPNVSVSRQHACVRVSPDGAEVVDLNSQNGVFLNGEQVNQAPLQSGDEIGIGRFGVVYLGDAPGERLYQGRSVTYIPRYDSAMVAAMDTTGTFALNAADLKRVQQMQLKMEKSRLVLEGDASRVFVPGEQVLTFGPTGKVSIPGMARVGSIVAEVYWSGGAHVLVSKGLLSNVRINGTKITEQPLQNGDRVRIGKVGFLYQTPRKD